MTSPLSVAQGLRAQDGSIDLKFQGHPEDVHTDHPGDPKRSKIIKMSRRIQCKYIYIYLSYLPIYIYLYLKKYYIYKYVIITLYIYTYVQHIGAVNLCNFYIGPAKEWWQRLALKP